MSESVRERNDAQIFGSFFLGGNEFALAVSSVQEVVNEPDGYTSVPLAPGYLKGLFNLRGIIIPVLDLRELLGLKAEVPAESRKIAIVESEGCCVGLLFDRTGEIFRSQEEERSDFDQAHAAGVVSGVFKKDGGGRIVQILDVSKLFQLRHIPKDSSRDRSRRDGLARKRGSRKQCISFVVGPARCALPISDIGEILKIEKLNESALGVGHCIGSIDLRGTTVPVIDFTSLLGYREVDRSDSATQGSRRIIVMRLDNELFGLMVDAVDSIVSYFSEDLISFPMVDQKKADMFLGCITGQEEGDILLLDHQKVFDHAEINEITRGHSKLYQNKMGHAKEASSKCGARRTYITFRIGGLYAVAIHEVKEIIEYPEQLLQPPGLQSHVRGVLNLRGDLITVVDARAMYVAEGAKDPAVAHKVLILSRNGLHFGLVVDAVESIVTFAENDKIKLPTMLYAQGTNHVSADISEAVEVTDMNGAKRRMLILSVDSVVARASGSGSGALAA
ncbi:MAG: chemotaxis protein CheW [Bdellovibrionaceae bacterium]|nr:chemotaxis protein CheW [Pseudobdellovibrionaceae bacterium]